MWLINTETLRLKSFQVTAPRYAILSHRWGCDEDEVTFDQWQDDHDKISSKPGYLKIVQACKQAQADDLEYLWVDTNCIDKRSSAELSEAINSMYRYYGQAMICYAYLQDVLDTGPTPEDPGRQFEESLWFTRGWTLQELLAPRKLVFFTAEWRRIGTKSGLEDVISRITGIPKSYLQPNNIRSASIATRMCWVSNRVTTRLEDIAYCMLGILKIHM
ncbi:vegetative incompatibility protein HET-E-1 [Echria macrotheca]|uniref:Vegetative incompatibility protein HET-E-1 n=1 Tax=Echria macrotheca TaxID=438768 RepID=A0AAJ0BQR4_9PEZI|nr:vegetative incompatibility protein HET-E-1 [Echria macrotheca]